MANESRKVRRAIAKKGAPGDSTRSSSSASTNPASVINPLGPEQLRATYSRVGLILAAAWLIGLLVYSVVQSETAGYVALGLPAVVTVVVVGVLLWSLRRAKSAQAVAAVLQGVTTDDDRKRALEKLEQTTKKDDPTAIFARAQLEMQEDPKKALATLETINLNKVLAPVADEARSQRAMIHLMLGQVSLARQLIDNVEPKRAQDSRSRAMISAIVAEALARSGEPKKALSTLEVFSLDDQDLAQIKPQLLRAYAFVYAYTTRSKELRRVLKQLSSIDVRLLGGFLQQKTHPLLMKEAKQVVEQSGAVPRRMQIQRH